MCLTDETCSVDLSYENQQEEYKEPFNVKVLLRVRKSMETFVACYT